MSHQNRSRLTYIIKPNKVTCSNPDAVCVNIPEDEPGKKVNGEESGELGHSCVCKGTLQYIDGQGCACQGDG